MKEETRHWQYSLLSSNILFTIHHYCPTINKQLHASLPYCVTPQWSQGQALKHADATSNKTQ